MTDPTAREVVVARLRPHARRLFWPSLLLIAVCGAYGFFGARFSELWQTVVVASFAGLLIIIGWLIPMLSWLARRYTITTRRVVVRSGLFVRVRQELLYSRAFDVTVRKAGLQSLFGCGDVFVNLGGEGRVILEDVPSAYLVQETLHDLMERNGVPRLESPIG